MIEIRNLSKRFGHLQAVDNVTFNVTKGEVLGFLGPNGAGKSTTMKMVTGFLEPSAGDVSVCGHDVLRDPIAAKKCIGYLPEGAPLYGDMTPRSFLKFIAEIRAIPKTERAGRIDDVVSKVHIEGVMGQRIETLSKGFKRRVGLAQAILHDPQVLILDEPTDGLDPNQKHDVRQLILEMAKDKCIVLSTHILEEVPAVCTRAIVIAKGKVEFDGTPAQMQGMSDQHNALSVRFNSSSGVQIADLEVIEGLREVRIGSPWGDESCFTLIPSSDANAMQSVTDMATNRGWKIEHISIDEGRLDEVFRQVTGGTAS
jgi:ABC-2 type transport system ATP-binding protein